MKKTAFIFFFSVAVAIILPLFAVNGQKNTKKESKASSTKITDIAYEKEKSTDNFKVKLSKSKKIITLSERDYIFGCVAAEIPMSYLDEAIKAQCVASYTYALRKKENSEKDYDLTDDYKIDQCYLQDYKIKEKWGENYDEYSKRLYSLIDSVLGVRLTYGNKTALTVYHAVSNGKTLSAKEVWGTDIAYLTSVDSSADKLSEKYQSVVKVKKDEFLDFAEKETGKKISDIRSLKTQKSSNGKTEYLCFSGEKISSEALKKEYTFRSSSFDVNTVDGYVVFYVFGYGHGVGMSQNGANEMAKNGSTYKEILLHYYKGCKIREN